jgi:hypothetical protein
MRQGQEIPVRRNMRDFQRSKVYKWERSLPGWYEADVWISTSNNSAYRTSSGKPPIELAKIKEFIEIAWADYYVSSPPRVADGRRTRSATGSRWRLSYPRWSRAPGVILHELAHAMSNDKHGPIFVRVFISLMARYMDKNESELVRSAKAAGIKVASWQHKPKPIRRVRKHTKKLLEI